MNETSVFIKQKYPKEVVFLFYHVGKPLEDAMYEQEGPQRTIPTGALIVNFPTSRMVRNNFLLFINHPIYSVVIMAA